MKKLMILVLAVCLLSGCIGSLFGAKAPTIEEIKQVSKEALQESKPLIKGVVGEALNETKVQFDIELNPPSIDEPTAPSTGTGTGKLINNSKPPAGGSSSPINNNQNKCMTWLLLKMMWKWLALQVIATWVITIFLNLKGIKVSKALVSVGFNVIVLGGSQLIVHFTNWIPYNWIDLLITQISAFGVQIILYTSLIKKLISKSGKK